MMKTLISPALMGILSCTSPPAVRPDFYRRQDIWTVRISTYEEAYIQVTVLLRSVLQKAIEVYHRVQKQQNNNLDGDGTLIQ